MTGLIEVLRQNDMPCLTFACAVAERIIHCQVSLLCDLPELTVIKADDNRSRTGTLDDIITKRIAQSHPNKRWQSCFRRRMVLQDILEYIIVE
jgi:hypothetical protein